MSLFDLKVYSNENLKIKGKNIIRLRIITKC